MVMAVREKMISSLSCGREISQPLNQGSNLLLACAINQIIQTFVSAEYLMECTDVFKCRGVMSKVITMRLKRTMKMIMLTIKLRIFDADYQMLYLSYLADIFRCVNSGSSLSAKSIQSYLSKRYLGVYIPEVSPIVIVQTLADF